MKTFKKIAKWIGISLLVLLLLITGTYIAVYFKTQARINKQYTYTLPNITIPSDSLSIARGAFIPYQRLRRLPW